jgi:hypothetical protein
MPTATPFKAIGMGNGFPFLPRELAVEPVNGSIGMTISEYNTLYEGTYSLSTGQGFSQPFSNILDASSFFWNLYDFNLSSSVEAITESDVFSASVSNLAISQSVEIVPKNRACRSRGPYFRDNKSIYTKANFLFNGIYCYGTGANKKYYWGIINTYINPGVTVGLIAPRTYENRQYYYEYEDFILSITSNVKIQMAFYSPDPFVTVNADAEINSVNYYTY